MPRYDLSSGRHLRPATPDRLWNWVAAYTGVRVARQSVCDGHHAPFDIFATWQLDRPSLALCEGPRGGGKSFLAAIDTHLDSRHHPRHGTRILAGSKAQAKQVHGGLKEAVFDGRGLLGSDSDQIRRLGAERTLYKNGSSIEILTASPLSVRGPHVPSLKMDEVDEIDPAIREAAMGMAMTKLGLPPKVVMTSTHHNLGGPMEGLKEAAREANEQAPGSFPSHHFCVFEVLETCPAEVSGPYVGGEAAYENCPSCALRPWCHEDRDRHAGMPKAKRSSGHYTVASLVQKVRSVSTRVFEADYLCKGPKADGLWFSEFSEKPGGNVCERPLDPNLPVRLAVDAGVSYHTGGVFYQAWSDRLTGRPCVYCFADYYAEGLHSESNALALAEVLRGLDIPPESIARVALDPAASAETGVGPAALSEYERAFGSYRVSLAPRRSVSDGLNFLEMLVRLADGTRTLFIHPRCRHLISAFASYRRARRGGQWMGYPQEPQHPAEELIDSLRYGLWDAFPDGYPVPANLTSVPAHLLT